MKFTATAAILSLSGAAIAASYATPTKTPCPTNGSGYMPGKSMTGSAPNAPPADAPYVAPATASPTEAPYVAPTTAPNKGKKYKNGKKEKNAMTSTTGAAYTPTPAAASHTAPPAPMTATENPSTGDGYTAPTVMDSMTGSAPPSDRMVACEKPKGYTPAPAPAPVSAPAPAPKPYKALAPAPAAAPASGTRPAPVAISGDPRVPVVTPEPAARGSSVTSLEGAESMASGNTTVSVAADENSGVASGNAEEGGAVIGAATVGAAIGLSTSSRQALMYTDENGVDYFQDASGQWFYYPSPTPAPTMAPTPEPMGPGSSIGIDDLTAESSGDNSVSVGATEDMAAGSANGLTGAVAAAAVSPGAPGAIGLAF